MQLQSIAYNYVNTYLRNHMILNIIWQDNRSTNIIYYSSNNYKYKVNFLNAAYFTVQ